jgi:hypothetical protein
MKWMREMLTELEHFCEAFNRIANEMELLRQTNEQILGALLRLEKRLLKGGDPE